MRRRTLSIQCTECGTEVFSYVKFGKGHLIRCWKQRILTDNSKTKEGNVLCSCGNVIGVDEGLYIKGIKDFHSSYLKQIDFFDKSCT